MYLQEVVISPDIFELINRAYSEDDDVDIDLKSYKDNLYLKKLLIDKDKSRKSIFLNELIKIKQSSSDIGKKKIDSILKIFTKSDKRIKYITLDNKKVFSSNNKIHNQLLNLAIQSNSKIINSEDSTLKLHKNNHPQELKDIEILKMDDFISPPPDNISKVYSLVKAIKIPQGERFYFEEYLRPYVADAKHMVIQDRYLRKKDSGYFVLCKILELSKNLKSLVIYTIIREKDEDKFDRDNFDMTFSKFNQLLKKEFKHIEIDIKSTNKEIGKDRKIKTELFEIEFSPGIDFVNKDYVAKKNPVKITFNYKEECFEKKFNIATSNT